MLDKIKHIATDVRNRVEYYSDVYGYDLGGLCAIASRALYEEFKQHGIKSTIHLYEDFCYSHFFVMVDDCVVDITATQFGLKDRVVVVHRECASREFWTTTKVFKTGKASLKYQRDTGWDETQIWPLGDKTLKV